MHMVLVMLGGVVLLGVFILFGWLWGASSAAMALATRYFVPFWLLVAAANMWVGVHHAGYSVRDELPILLVIFLVPAVTAALVGWWMVRG